MVDIMVPIEVREKQRQRERTEYAPRQVPHAASLSRIELDRQRRQAQEEADKTAE